MTTVPTSAPPVDTDWFRTVLGRFASGVTVLSSTSDGDPVGLTCQSFFSLSVDPPMVAFSVARSSTSYPAIRAAGTFVVNVLAASQHGVSAALGRRGPDKWDGVEYGPGEITGHPVLEGALAHVECRLAAEYDGGDHLIVTADVLGLGHTLAEDARPLLYYRSRYHGLADPLVG